MAINSKAIRELINGHQKFMKQADIAERYFLNNNDIRNKGAANLYQNGAAAEINPLRLADNRVSHDWHTLLVTQKIGYLFTYPPLFDIGNKQANEKLSQVLGDGFTGKLSTLGIDASNTGVGWLHYWRNQKGEFCYERVDPRQIIPIFDNSLLGGLTGVLRCYMILNPETGNQEQISEFWDSTKVQFYKQNTYGNFAYFTYPEIGQEMRHQMGEVPFIPFWNNVTHTPDLPLYKDLIDAYDKVYSGFHNDIDDVQEVIFVIKNYGGTDKEEFIKDLKLNKTIQVDGDGGVDTIRAEIPYEAREAFLDRTRKQIFTSGMGVDPDQQNFGNSSGVALKFLYSLLELKAGLMETQFRSGLAQLVNAICRCTGLPQPEKLIQTWTRNAVQNDLETAQIAQQSIGVISDQTVLKNHPWVEDAEAEQKQLKKELAEKEAQYAFPHERLEGDEGGSNEKP